MADGQDLAKTAENHFLVGYIPRQADTVDAEALHISTPGTGYQFFLLWVALLPGLPDFFDDTSCCEGGAAWGIQLFIMMILDNLNIREIFSLN